MTLAPVTHRPRIAIVSQRGLQHHVSRSSFYEFEDLVATVEDASWVVPEWTPSGPINRHLSRLLKWQGLELKRIPRVTPLKLREHFDLMIVFCLTENDLKQLKHLQNWRAHCDQAIVWIGEMWIRKVDQFAADLRLFDNFDEIFLDFGGTADVLSRRLRRPVHFLPFGVDTQRFSPPPDAPERTIDLLSVGRRSDANHAALLDYSRRSGIHYQYDATWLTDVHDFSDHRRQLVHRIHRAKSFLVGPAKLNVPAQTLGQSELSARYLEGAAAGAALIGESPQAAQFTELFDWPEAIVEWDMNRTTPRHSMSCFTTPSDSSGFRKPMWCSASADTIGSTAGKRFYRRSA